MIYRMAQDLASRLVARKYPVQVWYGREPVTREGCDSLRIDFARDTQGGDQTRGPAGTSRNPRAPFVRELGVTAVVTASSSFEGARECEHEHECDALVDALQVELYAWGAETKAGAITFVESRYLAPEERAPDAEMLPGAAYLLRFRVPRGVTAKDYEGAARPTGRQTDAALGSILLQVAGGAVEVVPPPEEPED